MSQGGTADGADYAQADAHREHPFHHGAGTSVDRQACDSSDELPSEITCRMGCRGVYLRLSLNTDSDKNKQQEIADKVLL